MAQATNAGRDVSAGVLLAVNSAPVQVGMRTRSGLIGVIRGAFTVPVVDTTPPVVTAVTPTPATLPGAAGGFSSDFRVAKSTAVVIDVTDATPGLSLVYVTDSNGATVYRATSFAGDYVPGSARATIANGIRLTILPSDGWPAGADPTAQTFVTLKVDAIDLAGNVTSTTLVWTLPAAVYASPTVIATPVAVGVDHVANALARLCEQFRSN